MHPETDDDAELFRAEMRDVKRLHPHDRVTQPRPPSGRALQREADEREVLQEMMHGPPVDSGDELSYRGPGLQEAAFRRLKRGAFHVSGELDLHGMTSAEASIAIVQFLAEARDRDWRCVRIIHGKGIRSKGQGPVLKQRVDGWLRRHRDVLAFCSARPEHGGTGAVYVLLRRA
jgi:DNA-nicking Smr family endonuclease